MARLAADLDQPPRTLRAPRASKAAASASLTILFGSQTGNARHIAEALAKQAQGKGITAKVVDMAEYKTSQLKNEQYLVIVTSTYGEGEPPDNACQFYQLAQQWQQSFNQLQFAVLALGDRSYQQFCAFGHWLQQWLHHRQFGW